MATKNPFERVLANRPDALGISPESLIGQDPRSPYTKSRYAAAIARLIDRLMTRADAVKGEQRRGKRRLKGDPTSNNTIRTYLKALELFSYYSVAQFGREIDPREITTDIASDFGKWMAGEGPGPDVRGMYVRAFGGDFGSLYEAVARSCSIYGQASILQIVEQLPIDVRDRLVRFSSDARLAPDLSAVHRMLGRLIRAFRTIMRSPTIAELRQGEKQIWSEREQDPMTYRYAMAPRANLATGSVVTHLCSLSALWSEMSKPASPDEAPMAFNPWKSVYAQWKWRLRKERENAVAAGNMHIMTTPLARSMLNACVGTDLPHRRDSFALSMLLFLGLRAEELAGLLRSDLRDSAGALSLNVLGKGNKVRNIPLDSVARDALMLLTGKLEELARDTFMNEQGERIKTYRATYCASLLSADAPLVPSLIRWGCNEREGNAEADAREGLDTSGVRALVQKIADRARVKVTATGEIRGFTDDERSRIHPHAFRHYAATSSKEAGLDLMEIKRMLGHESIVTTEGYIAITPQLSSAFSAAVYQTLNRRGPLSQEELAAAKRTTLSPLADPSIVEWEPEAGSTVLPGRIASLTPAERQTIVESPSWAYERAEELLAYLPHGIPAKAFSARVKRQESEAERAVEDARSSGDAVGYSQAVQALASVRAMHLWTTFRMGRISHLPWWAGRANRWKGVELAPIISFAQVAAENTADAELLVSLRQLHDKFYAEKGPTAAAAMVAWLGELLDIVGIQFVRAMSDRQDTWIPFVSTASPDSAVVREHSPDAIVRWFEAFGGTIRATGYKSAKNRGNIALAAMDSLPDWFFVPDPLTDAKYGLSRQERAELRSWVTGLQATRPSRMRAEQWLEQMAVRIAAWARQAQQYRARTGQAWKWQSEYSSQPAAALGAEALDIAQEFDMRFPSIQERLDVASLADALPKPVTDAAVHQALARTLIDKGIDVGNPTQVTMTPVMRMRAGSLHMFDPALLTFDANDTIAHDEATKRWWYERYGSDSECVVKRAMRTLWERRKRTLRSQHHGLIARHFDLELSALIPCAAEIESRIAASGWTAPATVDETVQASKVLWAGLTDVLRAGQGATPVESVPAAAATQFWSKELPEAVRFVDQYAPAIVSVTDGNADAAEAVERLRAEIAEEPSPQEQQAVFEQAAEQMGGQALEDIMQEQSEEQFEKLRDRQKADRAAMRAQTLSSKMESAQKSASEMAATATDEYLGWKLDPSLFWQSIDAGTAKWLVFSVFRGEGAVLEMRFMRAVAAAVKRLRPSIWWNEKARVIRFRWKGGKGGLNLFASSVLPADEPAVFVAFWKQRQSMIANVGPRWVDPQPWAPAWPDYPMPDNRDAQDEFVARLCWPAAGSDDPIDGARFHSCMCQYARWKRNGVRSEGILPAGWSPSAQPLPSAAPYLPHPVDFAFAVVRPS